MTPLQIVGAGLGRTGTTSLKLALEQLLGGPCYHMLEVFGHPEHVPVWLAAARDEHVGWDTLFADYVASVDWPGGSFWPELTEQYPDALVLLSVRDPDAWYDSARSTIFGFIDGEPDPNMAEWHAWITELFTRRFTMDLDDRDAAIAAFEAHNAAVRAAVPAEHLLEWTPADGWAPICERLGVPVPDEPFPRLNTREDWAARNAD